ncbi:MAG: hypothetical protein K1X53_00035 [Candidatus Sumerlaeaceae bacterium]|nr:hypothetical protein [Candidatus Sumerlaeaceae bacterium]
MVKYQAFILAAALISAAPASSQAGFLSALRDRNKDGAEQQAPEAVGQMPQQGPNAKPTPTPDPEKIKAGAAKLAKEMNWDKPPKDLLSRYAGKWDGNFWVYSTLGKMKQSNKVKIEGELQSDGTLAMKTLSYDLISKSWVTEENSIYAIEGDAIKVTIKRPNGQVARQTGHYSDGQVFLRADIKDGVEHFRERFDGQRFLIDGFGVYGSIKGDDSQVFIGRFVKQ